MTVKDKNWITFEDEGRSKSGKTRVWTVRGKGDELGEIKWYGRWRGYAFWVYGDYGYSLFEQTCLRQIADFVEEQTKLTRQSWRKKK